MKVLSWENVEEPIKLDIVPAPITDKSKSYADDELYSYYNTAFQKINSDIFINILTDNLVKILHTDGNFGYYAGFGINKAFFDNAEEIYFGYGKTPTNTEELTSVKPPLPFTRNDGQSYLPFYLDVNVANEKFQCEAYLIVVKGIHHFHFHINTQTAQIKKSQTVLDAIRWDACSVSEMVDEFLFGIQLTDTLGNPLPDVLYVQHLNAAIDWIENLLDITIVEKEFKDERHDFYRDDYRNWCYINLKHSPVKQVTKLQMMYGDRPSVDFPLDWVQLTKLTGQMTLFPQSGSANEMIIGQTGMLYGFQNGWSYAPSLWNISYEAGIDKNDKDMPVALLKEAIYKRACTNILNVWGDLIIGAGIASQSVSIDGLSQSIGTTQSAMFGGASARVEAYNKDIKEQILPILRQKFNGVRMVVLS